MAQFQRASQGSEPSALAVLVQVLYLHTAHSPSVPLYCSHAKSLDRTSVAWHDCCDCLWRWGFIRRLWCGRLISVWLKLAEPPYQVSSWRKRKEAVSRLAKRQRYHMITVADGYTSHPFFCAKSFSGGVWTPCVYPLIKAGNKSVLFVSSNRFKVHFQDDVAVFTISAFRLSDGWVAAWVKVDKLACQDKD